MSTCRIELFGPPIIRKDGEIVEGLRNKSVALLAYLAAERRPVRRDTVAALLWPESGQSAARGNLRTCIHQINRAILSGTIVSEGDLLSLNCEIVCTDLGDLCPRRFLEGFSLKGCVDFDDWEMATAERLREERLERLQELIEALLRSRRYRDALNRCRTLVSLDSMEESSYRLLIQAQCGCGHWAAAERSYRRCRAVLRRELGAEPEAETVRLEAAVLRRDPSLAAPKASPRRSLSEGAPPPAGLP